MKFHCLSLTIICVLGFTPFAAAEGAKDPNLFGVHIFRGVPYYEGLDSDKARHCLDMYLPKDHKDYPVLFMVHGGGWIKGDKNQFGLYSVLGRSLARHGIGMVSTNYRLSPAVQHPEHVRDVAKAFAWVHKNIGKHGGRNTEMFVGGHSAGGHLSALLATDETYLKEQGLSLRDIKGAIPVSGVYALPKDPQALFDSAFGKDPGIRLKASPTQQARPGTPPFLIFYADSEFPYCEGPNAEAFCKALLAKKNQAVTFEIKPRNHLSIMMNATNDTDPVFQAMLSFITTQVAMERLCGNGTDGIDCLRSCLGRYVVGAVAK